MNENENGNEEGAPVLTVAEAAHRLHVTIPRLRRMLTRADFAAQLQQVERQTRTGTRTSTVLPVSVLISLQAAFENGETFRPALEPEREQEQEQNGNENKNAALVTYQAQEIAFLRGELTAQRLAQEQERNRHAQEIARRDVAEGETRRLLGSAMQQAEERRQEVARLREQLALAAAPDPVQQAQADTPPIQVKVVVQDVPKADTQGVVSDTQRDVSTGTDNLLERSVHTPQKATSAEAGRKWWHFWK